MAPRAASVSTTGDGVDPTLKFVFSTLKHVEQIKVNWEEVAKDNGIGYARNAASKFKDILKKHGMKFESGVISGLGDASPTPKGSDGCAESGESKTAKGMKKPSPRKRKATGHDGDEVEDMTATTPKSAAKKKKYMTANVKKEASDAENGDDDQDNDAHAELDDYGSILYPF
ncbi:uncharacterized protein Z518_01194 [Rhinocladiella mackenziei CBS 650.93]|uniref:Myb-like DNA-binding domain-containing protein n=1 Tax=Rhinocladiella mackenziei CBS 650.93 TaxID=1442369 RepID=A0A0D2HHI2_9EURO|nr:uncharacterized protein Z518_01194 [Rhinocladiella mackenziei CBS 650.93]KIX10113.1 hypothetical protein Z518_01194 [Rhinocladiella mackenziei CBS 650.93]